MITTTISKKDDNTNFARENSQIISEKILSTQY